jgi:hypothetical protein
VDGATDGAVDGADDGAVLAAGEQALKARAAPAASTKMDLTFI